MKFHHPDDVDQGFPDSGFVLDHHNRLRTGRLGKGQFSTEKANSLGASFIRELAMTDLELIEAWNEACDRVEAARKTLLQAQAIGNGALRFSCEVTIEANQKELLALGREAFNRRLSLNRHGAIRQPELQDQPMAYY